MLEIENTDRWRRLSAAMMVNEAVTANIMAWVAQRAAATSYGKPPYASKPKNARQGLTGVVWSPHQLRRASVQSCQTRTYQSRIYKGQSNAGRRSDLLRTRASSEATREHFKALLWALVRGIDAEELNSHLARSREDLPWTYKHVAVDSEPSKAIQNT